LNFIRKKDKADFPFGELAEMLELPFWKVNLYNELNKN